MSGGNLILLNKPWGVMSQFSGSKPNLSDYVNQKGFYPAGRLDKDSEGLLLLTNDGKLQSRISNPRFKMDKTYWVQLEGDITPAALGDLKAGVLLKDGLTRPARARRIDCPLPKRDPDVRVRQSKPTSWVALTIREGKNRQVRRMTAAVGFPTLRLFRHKIGPWDSNGLQPGMTRQLQVNF